MQRISLAYLARFGEFIDCLGKFPVTDTTMAAIGPQLILAQQAIFGMHVTGSMYQPYLRASLESAAMLIERLQAATGNPPDPNKAVTSSEIAAIKVAFDTYKPIVQGELGAIDAYLVTRTGSHDTLSLLMSGELLFPADLIAKVPEAAFDAKEAGKCLAFEVPTACDFHIFRTTESVLRRYYSQVTGGKAPPKARNFGVYLHAMKQAGVGDAKVLAILKQMIDLYRNPLIHPEIALTVEEAMEIAGIARSAISAMLAALPAPPPTTTTAAITP